METPIHLLFYYTNSPVNKGLQIILFIFKPFVGWNKKREFAPLVMIEVSADIEIISSPG